MRIDSLAFYKLKNEILYGILILKNRKIIMEKLS